MKITKSYLLPSLLLALTACQSSEEAKLELQVTNEVAVEERQINSKPVVEQITTNNAQQVYWGDTHLHTSYSTDAGMLGNRLGPDQAYRFAKGEEVMSSIGGPAKLTRPLDWLVVADHAENLGLAPMIAESNAELLRDNWGKQIHDLVKAGKDTEAYIFWASNLIKGEDPLRNPKLTRSIWSRMLGFAKEHNQPGQFTALLGYEWSSAPNASNLHRIVVFRDDEETVAQILPFSAYDSEDPEALWQWMENYETNFGGKILAIPHNGNLSNGLMFAKTTLSGKALDRDYAERRSRWEPLYEVTQIKGDGEAHPLLSPRDKFADYETWDTGNFGTVAKNPEMLEYEYARSALKTGLQLERELGVNPFKFGLVGATDSHTSLSTAAEDNFFGKATPVEPGHFPGRWDKKITGVVPLTDGSGKDISLRSRDTAASGLQGVWAVENTRAALWDAMKRKETYATTGSRIQVRLFAGWNFADEDAASANYVSIGYQKGVPMGGDLSAAASGQSPTFLVKAARDPEGANLDRIQLIKGWTDELGALQEQVTDIACAERGVVKRQCDGDIANTVDVTTATYDNSIGSAQLSVVWKDPDFDARQRAFYYVRVLEIPTPRWTTYDAVKEGLKLPSDVPASHQERAYTSPVWYAP